VIRFSPLFAVLIYGFALATTQIILHFYKKKEDNNRNSTIDGFRGLLALGVFIHHSVIWYQYLQTGKWEIPRTNLYIHLGESCVSFFFMITSYLFVSKLIHAQNKIFDWWQFYKSRLYRLVPMYGITLFFLFLIVFYLSDWKLQVSVKELMISIFHWSTFTYTRMVNINNNEMTLIMGGGVIWSLAWEWLFYFSLPLISIIILRKLPPKIFLFLSIVAVSTYFVAHGVKFTHLYSFLGGSIVPVMTYYGLKIKNPTHFLWNGFVLIVFLGLMQFHSSEQFIPKTLLILIFTLIASGNSFFGLLKLKSLKLLGDMSYSLYLIHGLVLFVIIRFVFGKVYVLQLNQMQYWVFIAFLTPVLVMLSFTTYRFIEKPFMNKAKNKTTSNF